MDVAWVRFRTDAFLLVARSRRSWFAGRSQLFGGRAEPGPVKLQGRLLTQSRPRADGKVRTGNGPTGSSGSPSRAGVASYCPRFSRGGNLAAKVRFLAHLELP